VRRVKISWPPPGPLCRVPRGIVCFVWGIGGGAWQQFRACDARKYICGFSHLDGSIHTRHGTIIGVCRICDQDGVSLVIVVIVDKDARGPNRRHIVARVFRARYEQVIHGAGQADAHL
jgi:hypothetical protein